MNSFAIAPISIVWVPPCKKCKKRDTKQFRPFSLEYLTLKVVLEQYNKNELSDNIFDRINWPSKWEYWYFEYNTVARHNILGYYYVGGRSNVHEILSIISRTAFDSIQIRPAQERGFRKYCNFCHTTFCDECKWITMRYKDYRDSQHLTHCIEKY